ncbi:MAG: hypothetical protein V9G22_15690 [Ottowia sp.]
MAIASDAWSLWEVWGTGPERRSGRAAPSTDSQGFLAHGDGVQFDDAGYVGPPLRGLWGSATEDVWALPYEGDLQRWDGKAWTAYPGLDGARFMALGGTSPSDAWAVGLHGAALHWDGQAWTRSPCEAGTLVSAWAAGPDDVWASGEDGVLHFDGTSWR